MMALSPAERQRTHRLRVATNGAGDPNVTHPPVVVVSDALVAAVIAKLPRAGEEFPREQRDAWLKMIAMAFDVAYGPAGAAVSDKSSPTPSAAAAPATARQAHAGHKFFIALDGTVCNSSGEAVLVEDIPADEIVFDYRPPSGDFRDLESIAWADGTRGKDGLAAGVSFCGPG